MPASIAAFGAAAILACSGTALGTTGSGTPANVTKGGDQTASQARVLSVPVRVRGAAKTMGMRVERPNALYSKAIVMDTTLTGLASGVHGAYIVRNQVVVRTESVDLLRDSVQTLSSELAGLRVSTMLDQDGGVWAVDAADVQGAVAAAERLAALSFVSHAAVDSGPWVEPRKADIEAVIRHQEHVRSLRAPGVAPVGVPGGGARGGPDPLFGQQWHLQNGLNPGRDMNVAPVYADGITGAGVTVAVAAFGEGSPQTDHIDYGDPSGEDRFDESISQPANSNAPLDVLTTFYNGLIGATVNNGVGGQGVAPGVRLASMIRGTDIRESQSYAWLNNTIDIKVHPVFGFTYLTPDDGYSPGLFADYVMGSLDNSLRLGRDRKGTIHIFSTGLDGLLNSPYLGSGDPWQDIADAVGQVGVSVTNGYLAFPLYPGGQIHNYPPANDYRTFVIAPVGEDNNHEPVSSIGTGVFASTYTDSSNVAFAPFGTSVRGLTSTTTGDGFVVDQLDDGNASSAAIAAGVFALMLEANPSLSVRDIQHIIADTAVTTGLGYDFLNSYVNVTPGALMTGATSNWESNGEFRIHSDQFGFGLIDADAAVDMARNFNPPSRLFVLDSGLVEELDLTIPDATVEEVGENASIYTFRPDVGIPFCIRENFEVEAVEVELTIAGDGGGNDLVIELVSPYGTRSNLNYPLSFNLLTGTTDETPGVVDSELDTDGFANVVVGGTNYAFYRHKFTSFKHWDELSGGRWQINFWDVGPDEELPEGEEPADPPDATMPGADHVTDFTAPLAVPPNPAREEKTVESYRIRVFGTDGGVEVFFGCDPFETNCPGDLNGDGVVNFNDLTIFLAWYNTANQLGDINGD
ncbi:MAG: S8 family serine peptidase, partial [Planctomycetota bacterium]